MGEKECVCEVVFESVYMPRKSDATIPITFKNMIYHRSFKDKLGLFWNWIKNREGLTFKEWLEKPRKLETEWIHIEIRSDEVEKNKNYNFTEAQKLKFAQANLTNLLFNIENDKLHQDFKRD